MSIGCRSSEGILLVDVVMFAGERDLLEARLDIVQADVTVVFEGDRAFTGEPRERVGVGSLPVEYVPVVTGQDGNPWQNEFGQRRAGFAALTGLGLPDDAVIGLFDVDEIPDPVKIRVPHPVSVWRMDKFQMSARWFQQRELTGVSGLWRDLRGEDVAHVRVSRGGLPVIEGGWHLSSFLSEADLLAKWVGFSHQELMRPDMGLWVSECWRNGWAVENGAELEERTGFEGVPERVLRGPAFWLRGRDA
jgi:hypothetical protein